MHLGHACPNGGKPRRFAVPLFDVPSWPSVTDEALPPGVVRLPQRSLPTAGESEARLQHHLADRPTSTAEVIPLNADAGVALRQALAQLKQVRH